tara:strand:- start:937 stop:2799 length:1863 start_codon:yes stop_codon:yes gene_type:complete
MSLVVCSNKEQDGNTLRQDQSIYSAWSFRNQLPSTMKIPANSQVALQSCKVNVDGRVVFSRNNHRFYYYFGEKLDRAGGDPQIEDTTSYPAIATLTLDSEKGQVVEMSLDDFAERIGKVLNSVAYHPNVRNQISSSVLRNASGLDFLGYNITFDQQNPTLNSVPINGAFEGFYKKDQDIDGIFSYTNGIFTRETDDEFENCVGICVDEPFSLNNGSFIVNISGTDANVNSSGVEWHVGLSRYINTPSQDGGFCYPPYYDWASDDQMGFMQEFFVDFGVARNRNGELVAYHTAFDPNANYDQAIRKYEIDYWNNGESDFNGGGRHVFDVNSVYTKIGFFSLGEQMRASLYNSSTTKWDDITDYSVVGGPTSHFKPVNQSCWCLHPVLSIDRDTDAENCKMKIEEYTACPITGYSAKEVNKGGWYETLELLRPGPKRCQELETTRKWSDPADSSNDYVQKSKNASGGTNLNHVLVLEQSNLYEPTFGANARELFGFTNSILDAPNSITGSQVVYQSDRVPNLTSSMAMFVRLNNFGQNVHNAHTGNRSKILAHLPRFDNTQSTGRLYFEPNNFVWLDLDNPSEMNINEFDISFCYVNEQYAQILTGQSIVCLYFRKKPKELM